MGPETSANIVVTDYSVGDDRLAGHWLVAQATHEAQELIFVAGPGNRSTAVSLLNLLDDIPAANKQLASPLDSPPQISYGADRFTNSNLRYQPTPGNIVYSIHGDLGHDTADVGLASIWQRSGLVYEQLQQTDIPVSVLSLCATTELPFALRALESKISELVIMGGVLSIQGNTGPHKEANLTHDPQATLATFELARESNVPIVLVPLDVTEQEDVLFTPDRLAYLEDRIGTGYGMKVINSVVGPHSVYGRFYMSRTHNRDRFPYDAIPYAGIPAHDLTAAIVQADFRGDRSVFKYVRRDIQPDDFGQVSVVRDYMTPNFDAIVAGPIKDYDRFWEMTAEYFASFR